MVGKLHKGIFLHGEYLIFDELINYSSDFRPTANLGIPSKGVLHLEILKQLFITINISSQQLDQNYFCQLFTIYCNKICEIIVYYYKIFKVVNFLLQSIAIKFVK